MQGVRIEFEPTPGAVPRAHSHRTALGCAQLWPTSHVAGAVLAMGRVRVRVRHVMRCGKPAVASHWRGSVERGRATARPHPLFCLHVLCHDR